jgi:Copper transport outer membrane protein, MctB
VTRLRYTILTFSVVLFSLALGIALGGGPLQGPVQGTLRSQVEAVSDNGSDEVALMRQNRALQATARFDRGFAQALSGDLLDDQLGSSSTVVLALPGVPAALTKAVTDDLAEAGGSVTTTLQVGQQLVEPTARPLVDELSKRLLEDLDDVDVPDDASAYTRTGAVLSRALVTSSEGGEPMDDPARSVFNTLTTAKLLHGAEPDQRANSVVVLLPETTHRQVASGGRGLILTELLAALDEASDGVLVAGPPSSAAPRGLLAYVRTSASTAEDVSTVDSVGSRAGQLVTVLALAEQVGGDVGHYGVADGADSLLPEDELNP